MFYDEQKAITDCDSEPSLVFALLRENHVGVIDKILSRKSFDFNVTDETGNTILMRLLKRGCFDIVLKHMKDKRWNVNHQNYDGDTFSHILTSINDSRVNEVMKVLLKNKDFVPNIRNNEGETILDKAISNNYIYTTTKILEDKRFDSVGIFSFKKLYDTFIKTKNFGKYTRLNNLEMIVDTLEDRNIAPEVKEIITNIKDNYVTIKEEFINNKTEKIDLIVSTAMVTA